MTFFDLIGESLQPIRIYIRKWFLRRAIRSTQNHLEVIELEVANAFRAQAYLHKMQAEELSELRSLL